jgi:DNA-directed RNA polymerase subunit L
LSSMGMTLNVQKTGTLKHVNWLQITTKKIYRQQEEEPMKVKLLKKSENELKIEIEGTSHGLCNLLAKRLLEDKKVEFAGYDLPHPLASSPIIYVRMKGANKPEDALIEAASKVREANDAFSKELDRVLKA